MATRACVFLIVLFAATKSSMDLKPQLWLWNVGQGQWATVTDGVSCFHFDAGGEKAPFKKILALCRTKKNYIWLSHWDWDHIGFINRLKSLLPNSCLLGIPNGPTSPRKTILIGQLKLCPDKIRFPYWDKGKASSANQSSRVAYFMHVLIPGDSPKDQEAYWTRNLNLSNARLLLVGHHGSRTSTSRDLLMSLPALKMALVSARFKRYGHPHPDTENLFKKFLIPVIKTEDWGDLSIDL